MALTPLSKVLSQQRSGFTQQIKQLQGVAQSIRQSQNRRQQVAEQLATEKEMVQFRSDQELERQIDYYEQVTEPQQRAQQQQEYLDKIAESQQQAQEEVKQLEKEFYTNKYSELAQYNLMKPVFGTQSTEDGQVVPAAYIEGEPYSISQYRQLAAQKKPVADWLSKLEKRLDNGDLPQNLDEEERFVGGTEVVDQNTAREILKNVRTDDEFRRQVEKRVLNEGYTMTPPSEDSPEGGGTRKDSPVYSFFSKSKTKLAGDPVRKYGAFKDQSFWDFSSPEPRQRQINFNTVDNTSELLEQIRTVSSDLYGFDPDKLPSGDARKQLMNGIEPEGIQDEEIQENVDNFLQAREQHKDDVNDIMFWYDGTQNMFYEWSEDHGAAFGMQDVKPNFFNWQGPQDLSGAFTPKENANQLLDEANQMKLEGLE